MNLLLILLSLVAFASSDSDQCWGDEIGTQLAYNLSVALTNAVSGQGSEKPADYLPDYFIYRHCYFTLNKEQILSMPSELNFAVWQGFRDYSGSMLIHAVKPFTPYPMRIRAQFNNTLQGGYQIQRMIVHCPGIGFA